jgi:hypothetical protein
MADTFRRDLYPWIKTRAALTVILGGADRPRWYHSRAPQETPRPFVTWRVVDAPGHGHLGGVSAIESVTLELDAWADNEEELDQLATAIDGTFHGFRGLIGSTSVRSCRRQTRQDLPEPAEPGGEEDRERERFAFTVWYAT